jgi:uncharacterized protein
MTHRSGRSSAASASDVQQPPVERALEPRAVTSRQQQHRQHPRPATQQIVRERAGDIAVYTGEDEARFYLQPVPPGVWENKVTVRSTCWSRMYAPGQFVDRVSPTPLMMVVAKHDRTAVTDLQLAAYERALEPKRLVPFAGGHFDPYGAAFDTAASAAVEWFDTHLRPRSTTPTTPLERADAVRALA